MNAKRPHQLTLRTYSVWSSCLPLEPARKVLAVSASYAVGQVAREDGRPWRYWQACLASQQ